LKTSPVPLGIDVLYFYRHVTEIIHALGSHQAKRQKDVKNIWGEKGSSKVVKIAHEPAGKK